MVNVTKKKSIGNTIPTERILKLREDLEIMDYDEEDTKEDIIQRVLYELQNIILEQVRNN